MRFRINPLLIIYILALAIPAFTQEIDQSKARDFLKIGNESARRNHYQEALNYFKDGLDIDPQNTSLLFEKAKALIGLNRVEDGIEVLKQILDIDEKSLDAHLYLAKYYWRIKQDAQQAQHHLESIQKNHPNELQAYSLLGDIYLSQNQMEKAEAVFQELINRNPKSSDGYIGLGKTYQKRQQWEKAESAFLKAIKINPIEPEPHRLYATALARNGKREASRKILKNYQVLYELQEQQTQLERASRRAPNNPNTWLRLGHVYMKRKKHQDAMFCFRRTLELDSDNATAYNLLGNLLIQKNNIQEALYHLLQALSLEPDNAAIYNSLGVCYLMQERYEPAVQNFEKAIEMGFDNEGVRKNLKVAKEKLE